MTIETFKLLLLAITYDFKNNDLFIKSLDDNEATFKFVHHLETTSKDVLYETISIKKLEERAEDLMFALKDDEEFAEDCKEVSEEWIEAWKAYKQIKLV